MGHLPVTTAWLIAAARKSPSMPSGDRVIDIYNSLDGLLEAVASRDREGWDVLSAGLVRSGRWWGEYERTRR